MRAIKAIAEGSELDRPGDVVVYDDDDDDSDDDVMKDHVDYVDYEER